MARERIHDLKGLLNNPMVPEHFYIGHVEPMISDFKQVAKMVSGVLGALKRGEHGGIRDEAVKVDKESSALQEDIELIIEELEGGLHEDVQFILDVVIEELGYDGLIGQVQKGSMIHTICQLHGMCMRLNGIREHVAKHMLNRIQLDEAKEQELDLENHDVKAQEVAGEGIDMDS